MKTKLITLGKLPSISKIPIQGNDMAAISKIFMAGKGLIIDVV